MDNTIKFLNCLNVITFVLCRYDFLTNMILKIVSIEFLKVIVGIKALFVAQNCAFLLPPKPRTKVRDLFKAKKHLPFGKCFYQSDFAGIRTQGPYIKSVLLYQLSYEILSFLRVQRYGIIFLLNKF